MFCCVAVKEEVKIYPAGESEPLIVELIIDPGVAPLVEFPKIWMVGPVGSANTDTTIESANIARRMIVFDDNLH